MQDCGAVAVEHALGVTGRAAGVAQAGGFVLVKAGPLEGIVLAVHQVFVAQQAGNLAVGWHVAAVGHQHKVLDGGQACGHRLHQGQESFVKAQHMVFGVVGNPDHLVGVQARVERVQHRT